MDKQVVLKGSTLKVQLFWEHSDETVNLDTIDFYVEYYTNIRVRVRVEKINVVREEVETESGTVEVNWYVYVNTNVTGTGNLALRLYAKIPDEDAPDGISVDYKEYVTDVMVKG